MAQDNKAGLESQVLSAAVEAGLIGQLDELEKISVDVRTNLVDMVQGQVDSVSITGQGLVMQKDIRVQEMQVQTDSIGINPLSAIFGDLKLTHPTDATVRIVLTEEDINRALKSDYIRSKIQPFELNVDGEITTLELQNIEIRLLDDNKVECCGKVRLAEMGNSRQINFICLLRPRTSSQPMLLEAFQCSPGEGITLEVIVPLMQKLKELVNLPYYEVEETAVRVKDMEVQKGSLTVCAEAYIKQIPSM